MVIEIRSYELKPGRGPAYADLFAAQVLPMLAASGHDVVYAGPSEHDADGFVLARAYPDEASRQRLQDAFYGSAEWREGPREAVLAMIERYTSAVLPISRDVLDAWRSILGARVALLR